MYSLIIFLIYQYPSTTTQHRFFYEKPFCTYDDGSNNTDSYDHKQFRAAAEAPGERDFNHVRRYRAVLGTLQMVSATTRRTRRCWTAPSRWRSSSSSGILTASSPKSASARTATTLQSKGIQSDPEALITFNQRQTGTSSTLLPTSIRSPSSSASLSVRV